jgi:hypothetical protein
MKRQWTVRRQFQACPDGEQRWDRAYQYLLKWAMTGQPAVPTQLLSNPATLQEVDHAGSDLRTSIHTASGSTTDR